MTGPLYHAYEVYKKGEYFKGYDPVHSSIVTLAERQQYLADYMTAEYDWVLIGVYTPEEVVDMSWTDRGLAHLEEDGHG